jgi:hypothetical protein
VPTVEPQSLVINIRQPPGALCGTGTVNGCDSENHPHSVC